jgi:hypothetical protein
MPFRDYEAFSPQVSEVFGDGDLGQSQNRLEMAHAQRALRQKVKNPQAGFITQTPVYLQEFHILVKTYTPTGI